MTSSETQPIHSVFERREFRLRPPVLLVECPNCGAEVRKPCRDSDHIRAGSPHQARIKLAESLIPEEPAG
jgi:hypothetical protein